VTVISCVRLALLITWFDSFYKGKGTKDIYYSFGWALSPIECNLAIIAASIPALWPLFRKAFPTLLSDLNYSYRVDGQSTSGHAGASARNTAFRSNNVRSNIARPMGRSHLDDDSDGDTYMMKSMGQNGQVDIRASTPTGSQDGIIDVKDGIMRTTDVEVGYEEVTKERDFGSDRGEYGRRKRPSYGM
jgi:hypothetical protein